MHWLVAEGVAIDQTAGIWAVIRIVFDHFTVKNAGEYLIECQSVCLSFFIGVVGNAYPIMADRPDNIFDIHVRHLPMRLTGSSPSWLA